MSSLFILFLSSCEKENFDNNSNSKRKGFKILSYSDNTNPNSRGIQNNILSFETEEEFNATVDSLETVFDNFQTEFTNNYKNMSDSDLNELVNNQNIDLELPLTNFENSIGFYSLRKKINEEEASWLQNPNPDFDKCPQLHPIESHAERALWNDKGEIMIAGKIYKYDDDKYIKIDDGEFSKLVFINSGDQNIFSNDAIFIEYLSDNTSNSSNSNYVCKRNNFKTGQSTSNGLVKTKLVYSNRIKSKSWEFGKHKMFANSYSYIKFNEGSWRKYVCTIKVNMTGFKYFGCSTSSTVNHSKERRANNVGVSHKRDNAFSVRYLNNIGSMKSYHAAISTSGIPSIEVNDFSF